MKYVSYGKFITTLKRLNLFVYQAVNVIFDNFKFVILKLKSMETHLFFQSWRLALGFC